jgi:hypothetical protein
LKRIALLITGLIISLGAAHAGIVLDGAHLVSIDPSTGSYAFGVLSTTACCDPASLYVGSYDPANVLATTLQADPDVWNDLNYALPTGTTHLVLVGNYPFASDYGTDLFFDETFGTGLVGASGSQITAYLDDSSTLSSGTDGAVQPSYGYYFPRVLNGALSYTNGMDTVTISDYATGANTDGTPFASFDLTVTDAVVTAAPEPGTISLVFGAAAGLCLFRLRSRKA